MKKIMKVDLREMAVFDGWLPRARWTDDGRLTKAVEYHMGVILS